MNLKIFLSFSICIHLSAALWGQRISIPQNALFKHLLSDTQSILYLPPSIKQFIPLSGDKQFFQQQLVKSSKGLFVFIQGSGVIYEAVSWNRQMVEFKRIDSTIYFGYNFDAFNFALKDALFSFGGYGFWHMNGLLRKFTKNKEWDVLPLEKEIPFCCSHHPFQFFEASNEFFWYLSSVKNEGVKAKNYVDSFFRLDLVKLTVTTLGKSEINLSDILKKAFVLTPWGILVHDLNSDNKDLLLDFKKNLIYQDIGNHVFEGAYSTYGTSTLSNTIIFYQNGFIYSSLFPFSILDSVPISFGNFVKTNQRLYAPSGEKEKLPAKIFFSKISIYIATIILIIVILTFVLLSWKPKKRSKDIINESKSELFTPLEKQLLIKFISQCKMNNHCNTDTMNNLLGVSQKTIEIQKKARTDFISGVNQKCKDYFQIKIDVIARKRYEEDKRTFLYTITPENINKLRYYLDELS